MSIIRTNEVSKADCITIAKKIRENIFEPSLSFKTSIFLCGADISDKTSIRYKVAQVLTHSFWYSLDFDIVYPEDVFEELLYSSSSPDLLSLENLLADSVDAVVVIPESSGSIAELGAFANNEKLRNKLICVNDIKYKKDKSFINLGPLKLIKSGDSDRVIFIDPNEIGKDKFEASNIFSQFIKDKEIEKIVSALRKLKKSSKRIDNKITLLQLDRFLLPTIYLLEPVTKSTLTEIVANAIESHKSSHSSTITALAMLIKKRFVELNADGYKLTRLGTEEFLSFRKKSNRIKHSEKTLAIDDLRLEVLNLKNRKKKLKV